MGGKRSVGRPRKPEHLARTARVTLMCTETYRDRLDDLAAKGGYADVAAMVEGAIERERKRLKARPLPPR